MKPSHLASPRLRGLQHGIALFAAAFASSTNSLLAEDDEFAEPSPVAVLTQVVRSDEEKTVRRYPARIRAVEQVDVVSRLSGVDRLRNPFLFPSAKITDKFSL